MQYTYFYKTKSMPVNYPLEYGFGDTDFFKVVSFATKHSDTEWLTSQIIMDEHGNEVCVFRSGELAGR